MNRFLFVKELMRCCAENGLYEGRSGNIQEAVDQARDDGTWSRCMTMDGREEEGILGRWGLELVSYCLSALVAIQLPAGGVVFWEQCSAFWAREELGDRQGKSHEAKCRAILQGARAMEIDLLPIEGQCQPHVVLGAPAGLPALKELRQNCSMDWVPPSLRAVVFVAQEMDYGDIYPEVSAGERQPGNWVRGCCAFQCF